MYICVWVCAYAHMCLIQAKCINAFVDSQDPDSFNC